MDDIYTTYIDFAPQKNRGNPVNLALFRPTWWSDDQLFKGGMTTIGKTFPLEVPKPLRKIGIFPQEDSFLVGKLYHPKLGTIISMFLDFYFFCWNSIYYILFGTFLLHGPLPWPSAVKHEQTFSQILVPSWQERTQLTSLRNCYHARA